MISIIKDPKISAIKFNHYLEVIHQWAHQWRLEFNHDPTKQAAELLLSCKTYHTDHTSLHFNGTIVIQVKEQTHLGLVFDSKLLFEKHLNEKITKAKNGIRIIKHLSKFLPIKFRDQIHKALVRSHVDYCDIIYHNPASYRQYTGVTRL